MSLVVFVRLCCHSGHGTGSYFYVPKPWRRLRNRLIAGLTYHFHRQWKLLEAGGWGGGGWALGEVFI